VLSRNGVFSRGHGGLRARAGSDQQKRRPREGRGRRVRTCFFPVLTGGTGDERERRVMTYPTHLIPTTVVGSYPQPDWLVDRSALAHHGVPRVSAHDIWRIPEAWLEAAQDDATVVAIREMERAGIDIVSDGEIRRESYSNRFALALDGIDSEHPGQVGRSGGGTTPVPRVVGKSRRRGPAELRDAEFLMAHATQATKITLPGPFTLSQQAENAFYADEEELAMDYAVAVNEE